MPWHSVPTLSLTHAPAQPPDAFLLPCPCWNPRPHLLHFPVFPLNIWSAPEIWLLVLSRGSCWGKRKLLGPISSELGPGKALADPPLLACSCQNEQTKRPWSLLPAIPTLEHSLRLGVVCTTLPPQPPQHLPTGHGCSLCQDLLGYV